MANQLTDRRKQEIVAEAETLQGYFHQKILPVVEDVRRDKGRVDAVATFRAAADYTMVSLRVQPDNTLQVERLNKKFSLLPDGEGGFKVEKPQRVELDHVRDTLAILNREFHLATPKFRAVVPRGQVQTPVTPFQYDYTMTNNRGTQRRMHMQGAREFLGMDIDLDLDK